MWETACGVPRSKEWRVSSVEKNGGKRVFPLKIIAFLNKERFFFASEMKGLSQITICEGFCLLLCF